MAVVELTQYVRPSGRKETVTTEVTEEAAGHAKDMELSREVLLNGKVAIYGKYPSWEEEDEVCEIATNGPGIKSPPNVLMRVIDSVRIKGK